MENLFKVTMILVPKGELSPDLRGEIGSFHVIKLLSYTSF